MQADKLKGSTVKKRENAPFQARGSGVIPGQGCTIASINGYSSREKSPENEKERLYAWGKRKKGGGNFGEISTQIKQQKSVRQEREENRFL